MSVTRDPVISFFLDGEAVTSRRGRTVAAFLLEQGIYNFRCSPAGSARGPFCMMGACQECAIFIDGQIQRACQTPVRDGMRVRLAGASA